MEAPTTIIIFRAGAAAAALKEPAPMVIITMLQSEEYRPNGMRPQNFNQRFNRLSIIFLKKYLAVIESKSGGLKCCFLSNRSLLLNKMVCIT